MIDLGKEILIKYKELIMYGIFGVGATVINIVVFFLCRKVGLALVPANSFAWVVAFIFAFITNKLWVFESKEWKGQTAVKEMLGFLTARLTTLFLDIFLMWLLVDMLAINDILSKIVVNIVVIAVNYVASKFLIFS